MTIDYLMIIIFSISMLIYFGYLTIFIVGFFLGLKQFSVEKPKVSIIVAARDEEDCIERCINSIRNQTYPKELFEVIIVNDQSEDKTEDMVKSLQNKYDNLKLISANDRPDNFAPKKFAINEALKIAIGEIILTTDADITVESKWIESIVSFFEENVGLVVGLSSVRNDHTKKLFQKFEALDF